MGYGRTVEVPSLETNAFFASSGREKNARALALQVDTQWCKPDKLASLQSILQSYSGGSCPVQLDILHPDVAVSLKCGAHWYITPEDQLLHELKQCLGEQAVKLAFH